MKRAIGLAFVTIACIVGFLMVKGSLPFMPIFGSSMEPTLHSGGLLTIKPVNPKDIKIGDIIVFNVPPMVRDYYNYPPVVAHRVIKVNTTPSLSFRTKGDNTGEEPFTIRPVDIRGTVGNQIPFLGLPLLFFQSKQGLIFAIIALALLTIFLYGGELSRGSSWLHRGIFSPVINEEKRANRVLTRKIEATEKKMDSTEQALSKFAAAITEYAQHLASHTSAVQSLAEASHELKKGAAEQNRVLSVLMENMARPGQKQETITPMIETPPTEKPSEVNIPPFHRALYKMALEKPTPKIEKMVPVAEKLVIHAKKSVTKSEKPGEVAEPSSQRAPDKVYPPGCSRQRHPLSRW